MGRRLRLPVTVAFVLTGGVVAVGMSCGDDGSNGPCEPCVQRPGFSAPCPQNLCVDDNRKCELPQCVAAGDKHFCVPDQTDAGCPGGCVVDPDPCPSGCTPVG